MHLILHLLNSFLRVTGAERDVVAQDFPFRCFKPPHEVKNLQGGLVVQTFDPNLPFQAVTNLR